MQLKVLDLCKKVLGTEHPETLYSMANLAATYLAQEKYEKAEQLQLIALHLHKKVLGPEHPHTLANMANLAIIYANKGKHNEAENLQMEIHTTQQTAHA